MFTTPYLAASVVIQLEQTSITYRMLRVSNAATWQPQTCHESRIYHPYSFYTKIGEPADDIYCSLFVYLL